MKLMFVSDLHGSLYYCRLMREIWQAEQPDRLILLGDLLYHGPRNDLPRDYNPKGVIAILNEMKDEILCVRGNCEAEVDQMVLQFPILADYLMLMLKKRTCIVTHGHIYNKDKLPPMKKGDILLHGHTHLQALEDRGDYLYINPGSISLPKGDDVNSYMIYEDGIFTIRDLEGRSIKSMTIFH